MLFSDFKVIERLINPVKISNLFYFTPLTGFSFDSRTIQKGDGFIAITGKYQDGHKFINEAVNRGAAFIIAAKDLPDKPKVPFFLVEDTYKALGAIARYIRKKKKPFVYGVTGSVGKTTTKEMLSFLLQERFSVLKNYKTENNFLGVSKTFLSLRGENTVVLELGTNHQGEIAALAEMSLPDVGIITFIKPAHLEGLKDLAGVFREKISLLEASSRIKAVLNRDDVYLRKVNFTGKIYWFGRSKENDLYARLLSQNQKESVFLVCDKFKLVLPTQFCGFIVNVMAAVSGAYVLGISLKELIDKMNSFKDFLPSRMELKEAGGFLFLNDAYNANPYSFEQAFKIVKKYSLPKIAVIGDMLELGRQSIYYHKKLASQIIKGNFQYCLAMGRYTPYLVDRLKVLGYKRAIHFSSHKDIADFIKEKAGKRYLIFLKGSRNMELEKVIEGILNPEFALARSQ